MYLSRISYGFYFKESPLKDQLVSVLWYLTDIGNVKEILLIVLCSQKVPILLKCLLPISSNLIYCKIDSILSSKPSKYTDLCPAYCKSFYMFIPKHQLKLTITMKIYNFKQIWLKWLCIKARIINPEKSTLLIWLYSQDKSCMVITGMITKPVLLSYGMYNVPIRTKAANNPLKFQLVQSSYGIQIIIHLGNTILTSESQMWTLFWDT